MHDPPDALLVLVDAGDRGVSRDELLSAVWGDSYPSDSVISRAMADLRSAFGEKAGEQRYIRTLPKFGYQLDDWVIYAALRPGHADWDLFRVSLDDGTSQPIAVTAGVQEHGPAASRSLHQQVSYTGRLGT